MKSYGKTQAKSLLYITLCSLAVFLTAHIYYLSESGFSVYLHLYATKVWELLFPVVCGFILTVNYARRGSLKTLLFALALALSRLAYYWPYYYEYFVLDGGYTSADALLLSAVRSSIELCVTLVHLLVFFFGALLIITAMNKRSGTPSRSLSEFVLSSERDASAFDFSSPTVAVSLAMCAAELIYSFAFEIIDTVEFLSSSLNTLKPSELFTIILNYILIILVSLLSYFIILPRIRKRLI